MNQVLSYVLRGGVFLAGAIIAFGFFVHTLHVGQVTDQSAQILSELKSGQLIYSFQPPRRSSDFITGLSHLSANVIMALGLMMLIALPMLRVAITSILFLLQRDYLYFGISFWVLFTLIIGMMWS